MKWQYLRLSTGVLAAFLSLALTQPANSQKRRDDFGISREQADAILGELRAIRELIVSFGAGNTGKLPDQPNTTVTSKKLNAKAFPILGDPNAPITIVEFFDYQCPFCRNFHVSTFPALKKKYIDGGRARFISVDLPLPLHSDSVSAAAAAHCGGEQGQFWEVRDIFSRNPERLGHNDLLLLVRELDIDSLAFEACVNSDKYRNRVIAESREAASIHINVTPTFIVGRTVPDGIDGMIINGTQPLEVFDSAIKAAEGQH